MHKPIALAASVALLVAGCQSRSLTWHKVMATPKEVGDAERGDRAYAGALHQNLGATPHRVVTFEIAYFSKFRGTETTQRTAVIYHDEQNQRQPWWVMDHTLDKPVWVPNKPLAEQVAFFARRHARVVEVQDYTVSHEKSVQQLELARRPVATSKLQPAKGSAPAKSRSGSGVNAEAPAIEAKAADETPDPDSDLPVKDAPKPPKAKVVPAAASEKAQPSAAPKPAEKTPPPTSKTQEKPAAAQPSRRNVFQRILSTLNPTRRFRRTA